MAKTLLITSTSTSSDCVLTSDVGAGEVEVDRTNAPLVAGGASARTAHNLQRLLRLDQAATVRLSCRTGTTWSATNSDVTALQLQNGVERDATPPPPPVNVGGSDCDLGGGDGKLPDVELPPCS